MRTALPGGPLTCQTQVRANILEANSARVTKVTADELVASSATIGAPAVAVFCETRTSGEQPTAYAAGATSTRALTTTIYNSIAGARLDASATGGVLLPAGTYHVRATCPASQCGSTVARLTVADVADPLLAGSPAYAPPDSASSSVVSVVEGVIVLKKAGNVLVEQYFERRPPASVDSNGGVSAAGYVGGQCFTAVTFTKFA